MYFEDPFFWAAVVSSISSLLLYLINRRTFNLLSHKPIIEILDISIKPRIEDGMGGLESYSYVEFHVFNPSSYGNYITCDLRRFFFLSQIEAKGYLRTAIQIPRRGNFLELPEFGKIVVCMPLDYEKVKRYENSILLLTLWDIRGRKTRRFFRFANKKQ